MDNGVRLAIQFLSGKRRNIKIEIEQALSNYFFRMLSARCNLLKFLSMVLETLCTRSGLLACINTSHIFPVTSEEFHCNSQFSATLS